MTFPAFRPAPNQGARPEEYELENRALDPGGPVLDAMRKLAPWAGQTLVDLGCGSGYWLPGYAPEAGTVIGVEPDPALLALAAARDRRAQVLPGPAEQIPLPDARVEERLRGRAVTRVPRRGGLLADGPRGRPRAQLRVRAIRRD